MPTQQPSSSTSEVDSEAEGVPLFANGTPAVTRIAPPRAPEPASTALAFGLSAASVKGLSLAALVIQNSSSFMVLRYTCALHPVARRAPLRLHARGRADRRMPRAGARCAVRCTSRRWWCSWWRYANWSSAYSWSSSRQSSGAPCCARGEGGAGCGWRVRSCDARARGGGRHARAPRAVHAAVRRLFATRSSVNRARPSS